ncbi:hypothetical protein B0T26DRAFT_390425, partial [Lasiosphaeria miniovina]
DTRPCSRQPSFFASMVDSSTSMSDTANISRGIWAGHRLDITTLARHRDETNEMG